MFITFKHIKIGCSWHVQYTHESIFFLLICLLVVDYWFCADPSVLISKICDDKNSVSKYTWNRLQRWKCFQKNIWKLWINQQFYLPLSKIYCAATWSGYKLLCCLFAWQLWAAIFTFWEIACIFERIALLLGTSYIRLRVEDFQMWIAAVVSCISNSSNWEFILLCSLSGLVIYCNAFIFIFNFLFSQ